MVARVLHNRCDRCSTCWYGLDSRCPSCAAERAGHTTRSRWAMPVPTLLPGLGEGGGQVEPIAMPIAGPGVRYGEIARRRHAGQARTLYVRPQHVGPCAVAVGATSAALAAVLPWWLAVPVLAGLMALVVGHRAQVDRMPPARLLRR